MSLYLQRRAGLREWTAQNSLALFIVSSTVNLRYLTGFTGEGIGVIGQDKIVVITDRRYEVEAMQELSDCEVRFAEQGYLKELAACISDRGKCRAGFESQHLSCASYEKLKALPHPAELVPAQDVVEKQRAVKDDGEIAAIRRAAQATDEALQAVFAELAVGISERELALRLRAAMVRAGGDDVSFDPVVAFGENSARAHAVPGNRQLARGEIVLIDAGTKVDGYCSDMTRTVVMGEPDDKFAEVYRIVRKAQQAAMAAIRPGVLAAEVDAQARAVIDASPYCGSFGHSLGHGVGLEVHEAPRLGKSSEEVLAAGHVVTDEPGIYMPQWGGIRLEELVLVTEQGAEPLTQTPYLEL